MKVGGSNGNSGAVLLAGRFEHVRELGRGGSGRVVLVRERGASDERLYAAKIVPAAHAQRLLWERDALARVRHPNLCEAHEVFELREITPEPFRLAPGVVVLVERWAEGLPSGEALSALSDEKRVDAVLRLAEQVTRALAAMGDAGLVHGDVKPSNIVVAPDLTTATLVDLGLAGAPGHRALFEGTPAYLAPEAFAGERSRSTDLYALGATMFDWLALAPPRPSSEPSGPGSVVEPLRRAASSLPATVPALLRALVLELLAASPVERPGSAREVLRRLAACGGGNVSTDLVLDLPVASDRAHAVLTLPLVGREVELRALVQAMETAGVVRLVGPRGAGKSRLMREAAHVLQAERARRGAPIPRVIETSSLPEESAGHALVLVDVETSEAAGWARVRAAELEGIALTFVLERGDVGVRTSREIVLGPLARPELSRLLGLLAPDAPVRTAALAAASQRHAGLPGRIVRAAALGPLALEHADADPTAGLLVGPGATLARALAISGGSIDAHLAHELGQRPEDARELERLGLASFDGTRLHLLDDEVLALRARLRATPDAELVARIVAAGRTIERVYALLLVDQRAAEVEALRAFAELRARGEVEAAARLGRVALRELAVPSAPMVLEVLDALRALGELGEARALGARVATPELAVARAELARLAGDRAEAAALLDVAPPSPMVHALRARLALDSGDLERARELATAALVSTAADPLAHLRALEVAALTAAAEPNELGLRIGRTLVELETARPLSAHVRRAARMRATSTLASLAAASARIGEAAALHAESASLAAALGERVAAATFEANVGLTALDLGRLGPALEALFGAARRQTIARLDGPLGRTLYNLANAALLAGDGARAELVAARALEVTSASGDRAAAVLTRVVRAEAALLAGRPLVARAELEAALLLAPAGGEEAIALARLSIVVASVGDGVLARDLAERARVAAGGRPLATLESLLARGRVELSLADAEGALVLAREAAALPAANGSYEARGRTLLFLADALEASGRGAEARVALEELGRHLDDALRSLSPAAQARMRGHPVARRALAMQRAPAAEPRGPTEGLPRAMAAIAREDRSRRVLDALLAAALERTAAERAFVVERGEGGLVTVRAARGGTGTLPKTERPSLSAAVRALDRREPVLSTDATEDITLRDAVSVHAMALRSVLAVPIVEAASPVERVLVLDDRLRPGAFSAEATRDVAALAEIAGITLAHAERLGRERAEVLAGRRRERSLARRLEQDRIDLADGKKPVIVARSAAMRAAVEVVARARGSTLPVLLVGESGTGKELLARSVAGSGPFVVASAASLPESLLESTLFGHVRGAFSGADRAQRGLFELADGGTLFLDEVGDTSPALQSKLLRVLEDGEVRPVGATRSRHVSVRVVCATRHDLLELVRAGTFREDLYWRIAVLTVLLPPLRERSEDVPALVRELVARHADGPSPRVTPDALTALTRYAWPGNVRELENELRRALLVVDRGVLGLEHLSPALRTEGEPSESLELGPQLEALERRIVARALEVHGRNQTRAAQALGVSRFGLSKMLVRLGLRE